MVIGYYLSAIPSEPNSELTHKQTDIQFHFFIMCIACETQEVTIMIL